MCLRPHRAGSTIPRLRPTGSSLGIAPVDYDPVVLHKPFGPRLAAGAPPSRASSMVAPVRPTRAPPFPVVPPEPLHTFHPLWPVRRYPHLRISVRGPGRSGTSTHLTRQLPGTHDWAYLTYGAPPAGWKTGLLIRRKTGRPHQFTFYLTRAPAETPLSTLVRVAGLRWTIESCFEEAKGETGLDEYEVRSWTGWHRHITLSMLAHAYLTVVRQHAIGGGSPRRAGRTAAAAHRAGSAAAALAFGVGATAFG